MKRRELIEAYNDYYCDRCSNLENNDYMCESCKPVFDKPTEFMSEE